MVFFFELSRYFEAILILPPDGVDLNKAFLLRL